MLPRRELTRGVKGLLECFEGLHGARTLAEKPDGVLAPDRQWARREGSHTQSGARNRQFLFRWIHLSDPTERDEAALPSDDFPPFDGTPSAGSGQAVTRPSEL